jgi:hypothetical protein
MNKLFKNISLKKSSCVKISNNFSKSGSGQKSSGSATSVAEPHHFYAAPTPAPGKNFDANPAPASAPTLLYSKAKFLKQTKF